MNKPSRKLEDTYAAEALAKRRFGGVKGINGIGVARRGSGYAVKINFVDEPDIEIPDQISGVDVIVDVVGKIRPLTQNAKQCVYHVLPHKGQWAVRRQDGGRVSSMHATQHEAIGVAGQGARKQHGVLVVHGRDGSIRERDSCQRQ